MRASDDLETAGHDAAEPREIVELMRANPGETVDVQRDHVSLGSIGRVV
jgi:hypothetical protein